MGISITTITKQPVELPAVDSTNAAPRASAAFALLYAILILVLSALSTGLMMYGYKYALKDDLSLSPTQLSYCNFAINLPLFLSFALGLLRDRWRPFGIADRPYLFVSPLIVFICCLIVGASHRSLFSLIASLIAINASAMLSGAAMSGMLALLSKHFGLSGRIAVAGMVIPSLVGMALMWLTGHLVQAAGFASICYVSAALAIPVIILAFFRPATLFPESAARISNSRLNLANEPLGSAVKRLLSSRPAMLAALICFLWDFTPGWGTPLFYQYTNVLRFSPAQFEFTNTIGIVGSTVSALSYVFFCFKFPLKKLLAVGIVICVAGSACLLFVHTFNSAVVVSLVIGLTYGLAEAGVYDVLYRASPRGLEGVAVLLGIAATYLAGTVADVFGSFLYERGGFHLALYTTLAATSAILPLVYLIPSKVIAIREGTPIEPFVVKDGQQALSTAALTLVAPGTDS